MCKVSSRDVKDSIDSFLTLKNVLSITDAFVFSRVDYCNGFFTFCNKYTIQRLQRVQNCFARLVFRLPRSSSCSNVTRELGWLRVNKRVDSKICCLVHKCVYGFVHPIWSYLSLLLVLRMLPRTLDPIMVPYCFVPFLKTLLFVAPFLSLLQGFGIPFPSMFE